jgi:hypothetical protein
VVQFDLNTQFNTLKAFASLSPELERGDNPGLKLAQRLWRNLFNSN